MYRYNIYYVRVVYYFMIAKIIIWIAPHAWKITHSIILYCAPTQLVCIYINYNIYIMYKIIFIIILVDLVKIIDIIYIYY